MKTRKLIQKYSHCFICGDKNETGLKIDFYCEDGKAKAEYTPTKDFEGYKDILHGGIISSLLDEVMIKAILAEDQKIVTAKIEVTFKIPAKIGEKLLLEGKITEDKKRLVLTTGKAFNQDGQIIATAKGTYFKVKGEMKTQLEQSLD